jgi:hypothetical protein
MDKTLKEEATYAVSEMECLLNHVGGLFLGLESTLEKALSTAEEKASRYSELSYIYGRKGPQTRGRSLATVLPKQLG